jgi:hypothetical protein
MSVGLLMMGDSPDVLRALGHTRELPRPDGLWQPEVPAGLTMRVRMDAKGRVGAIAYRSPMLVATNGVRPGAELPELQARFPGRREEQRWLSPRYGLVASLDARARARELEVSRPWLEQAPGRPAGH